ncbi:MAG: phosphoribosyltransferase [bacterium]|nr:phosphoribosyltransferase [bacterium]
MIFKNRVDAGKKLATALTDYKNQKDTMVVALPRGGVILGYEVANKLNCPLDIVVPRKIGAPGNEEFAIGAIAEDGEGFFDDNTIYSSNVSQEYIDKTVKTEKVEANRRLVTYRGNRPPLDLTDKTAIIVDDGIATGYTMLAAIESVKIKNAKKIIVAVPVTAKDSIETIIPKVDEVIYLDAPIFFGAVGMFYTEFNQTTDEEVIALLQKAQKLSTT